MAELVVDALFRTTAEQEAVPHAAIKVLISLLDILVYCNMLVFTFRLRPEEDPGANTRSSLKEARSAAKLTHDSRALLTVLIVRDVILAVLPLVRWGTGHHALLWPATHMQTIMRLCFVAVPLGLTLTARLGEANLRLSSAQTKWILLTLLHTIVALAFLQGFTETCIPNKETGISGAMSLGLQKMLSNGTEHVLRLFPLVGILGLQTLVNKTFSFFCAFGFLEHLYALHRHLACGLALNVVVHVITHITMAAGMKKMTGPHRLSWAKLGYTWATGWMGLLCLTVTILAVRLRKVDYDLFKVVHRTASWLFMSFISIHGAMRLVAPPVFPYFAGAYAMAVVLNWMWTPHVWAEIQEAKRVREGSRVLRLVLALEGKVARGFKPGNYVQMWLKDGGAAASAWYKKSWFNCNWHPFTVAYVETAEKDNGRQVLRMVFYIHCKGEGSATGRLLDTTTSSSTPLTSASSQLTTTPQLYVRGSFLSPLARALESDISGTMSIVSGVGITTATHVIQHSIQQQRPWALVLSTRDVEVARLALAFVADCLSRAGGQGYAPPFLLQIYLTGEMLEGVEEGHNLLGPIPLSGGE